MRTAVAYTLLILTIALLPATAEAKPVSSNVSATVFGTIDSRGAVRYYFTGAVSTRNLTFGCMEERRVDLFRVRPKGGAEKVATTKTKLLGRFVGGIERPLSTISGYFFVKAEPRVRKTGKGRLRCQAARSPTFLVELPSGLSE